jgi:hypothetical protein
LRPTATERERTIAVIQVIAAFVFLALAAIPLGDAVRGDASPFIWDALANDRTVQSNTGRIIAVAMYLAFYLVGFFAPYWVITFVLFIRRQNASGSGPVPAMPARDRAGRLLACLGTQILFLLFLRPIIYFMRGLPDDDWKLWPWMLGVVLGACLLWAAYLEFRHSNRHNDVRIPS